MNALLSAFGGMHPIVDAPAWVVLLLKITAILAAAWLVHAAIARANPRWRVVLWRVTAVSLLATPAVAWLLPSLEIRVPQPPVVNKPAVAATSPNIPWTDPRAIENTPINWPADMPETTAANPLPMSPIEPSETAAAPITTPPVLPALSPSKTSSAAPALPEPSPITWPILLLAAWLGGIAILSLRLCLGHYQISTIARRAIQAPHWVRAECSRVAEAIGCRRSVDVLQSTEVESPFLCGLRRPLLLLPARMCEASYRKDLPGILAHELAHVRSHDIYWNLGLQLISILLWLHPLTWRMRKAHLAACELVSDAVSAGFVGDVTDYCRTLARVAVDVYASLPSAGIAMARTSAIGRRLRVLRTKVFHLPLRRRSILCFGFSALLAVSVIGAIQFALAAPPAAEPTVKTDKPDVIPAERPAEPAAIADAKPKGDSMRFSAVDKNGKPIPGASVKLEKGSMSVTADSIILDGSSNVKVIGSKTLVASPGKAANAKTASLRVRVVDEDGKPLRNTRLNVKYLGHDANYKTDADGRATVVAPGPNQLFLSLIAYPDGYPPMRKWWKNDSGNELIPAEFTFTFAHGRTIGGVVRDEQGQPIQGAKLLLSITCKAMEQSQMCLALWETPQVTDAGGRWHLDHVPQRIDEMAIGQEHPNYISHTGLVQISDKEQQQIEDRAGVIVMKKGIPLTGAVTDPDGKPVADATIYLGEWNSPDRPRARTDQQGRYRFASLAPGGTVLTVVKPGLAPALRNINAQPSMKPVDFQLEKGNPLRVRVVDKNGKPLAGIFVTPDTWRGRRVLCDLPIRGQTDAEGHWAWTWAPKDAVKTSLALTGHVNYMSISNLPLVAQEAEHVVTMYSALTISGRVVDAATKQPIPNFRVIRGNAKEGEKDTYWDRRETVDGKDGHYKAMFTQALMSDYEDYLVRIEADGYQPAVSRAFKDNEGNVTYDFAMKKGKSLMVAVRLADGKPAADAEVAIFPEAPGKFYNMATFIKNGRLAYRDSSALSFKTDAKGIVLIPPQDNDYLAIVLHDQGFAKTTSEELTAKANASLSESLLPVAEITLQAWARLEGTVRVIGVRSQPMPNVKLDVYPMDNGGGERWGFLNFQEQTEANADGKFVFPKLKPGKWNVRELPLDKTTHRAASEKEVDLAPGKTVRVSLGEGQIPTTGSTVIGRIKWPHGEPPVADLARINATVLPKMPDPASPPKEIVDQGPDAVRAWMKKWWQSDEAKAWEQTIQKMQQYRVDPKFILIRPSGSFRAMNILPGQYRLTVGGFAKTKETPLPWERPPFFVYEGVLSVPTTADNAASKPLDVGTLSVIDMTPQMPAAEVKPPAPLTPGQKTAGPLRDNLDLLRYIVVTNAQNRAKIQTWQGKAAVQCRSDYGSQTTGQDYSATVEFVFDRARKSTRWNTTLDKWAKIVRGVDRPEPVPQILSGMITPQGLYRFGSDGSPGNPAKRPLTLTITSLGPWPMGQVQPDQFDFIPTFYYSRNETHGDLIESLQSCLGSASTPYMAAVKIIREGDQVTIDMDSGRNTSFYTVSLSQGCNPIAAEMTGFDSEQKFHWTYDLRDGVWLPKTWSRTYVEKKNGRNESRKVTFVENRINQPVESAAFSIRSLGLKSGDNIRDERVDPMNQYPYDDSADIRDLPDPTPPR